MVIYAKSSLILYYQFKKNVVEGYFLLFIFIYKSSLHPQTDCSAILQVHMVFKEIQSSNYHEYFRDCYFKHFFFLNWFQEVNVNSLAEMPNPMKRGGCRGVQQPVERKRQKF